MDKKDLEVLVWKTNQFQVSSLRGDSLYPLTKELSQGIMRRNQELSQSHLLPNQGLKRGFQFQSQALSQYTQLLALIGRNRYACTYRKAETVYGGGAGEEAGRQEG